MTSLYARFVLFLIAPALKLARLRELPSRATTPSVSAPERFYREWKAGRTPLPFVCCTAMQLYWAFQRWCDLNGERFPPTQVVFARTVLGLGDGLRKRVYEIDGKPRTAYVVQLPPDGVAMEEWVESRVALFEKSLRKYRNVYEAAEQTSSAAFSH